MQAASGEISGTHRRAPWRMAATVWLLVSAAWAIDPGAVGGIVRNSVTQAPVPHARVRLICESGPGYVETTGDDGAFHFEKVEPGEYRIDVERSGFTAGEFDVLHVAAGQATRDLTLTAVPLAVLRGKVVDGEGEPVPGAQVRAIRAVWVRGKRTWQSNGSAEADERGEFRLAQLDAGRYRLFAAPPQGNPLRFVISEGPGMPESRLAPAYYPSSPDLDAAAPLDLAAGQELGGFEVKLPMRPSFHIRGKADPAPDARGPFTAMLTAVKIDNGRWTDWFQTTGPLNKDGSFDLAGVLPGSYEVYVGRFERAATESIGVKITSRDVNGVALGRLQPARIQVRCLYDGDDKAESDKPAFQLRRIGRRYAGGVIDDDDTDFAGLRQSDANLRIANVQPGIYEPLLAPGARQYVESATYNGQPLTDGAIDVAGGSEGELEVRLAAANGAIGGELKAPGSAVAVVVAESPTPGNPAVRQAPASSGGRFSVTNLPPARYLVFAVPPGGRWPWENAAFVKLLSGSAAAVELAGSGSVQVELALVPEEALRRAEEQVP